MERSFLQALFVVVQLLVQPSVLEGDRERRRHGRQQLLMSIRKRVVLGALEIHHADQAILEQERHHQLGTRANLRSARDVARVEVDVGHSHRLAQRGGGAADAVTQGDRSRGFDLASVSIDRKPGFQDLLALVEEHHRVDVVVDDLPQAGCRPCAAVAGGSGSTSFPG